MSDTFSGEWGQTAWNGAPAASSSSGSTPATADTQGASSPSGDSLFNLYSEFSQDQTESTADDTTADAQSGLYGQGDPQGLVAAGKTIESGTQQAGQAVAQQVAASTQSVEQQNRGFFGSLISFLGNWFIRGAVIIVGLVFLVIALDRLTGASDKASAAVSKLPIVPV
jgi:hypothetical protein